MSETYGEFEQRAMDFYYFLLNEKEGLIKLLSKTDSDSTSVDYLNGNIAVLDEAIQSTDTILNNTEIKESLFYFYYSEFYQMRTKFRAMHLTYKISEQTEFNRGKDRGARDLRKYCEILLDSMQWHEIFDRMTRAKSVTAS